MALHVDSISVTKGEARNAMDIFVCAHQCACAVVSTWRPEIPVLCLPRFSPILRPSFSLNLELTHLIRPDSQ